MNDKQHEDQSAWRLRETLWRLYNRPDPPRPWEGGGSLPWNDPEFSQRMLREHLDQSHGAASRKTAERDLQIGWLWPQLSLFDGARVLDVTCGPGLYAVDLARRGCRVTGIDFAPAAIAYARELAAAESVAHRCTFVEADVRSTAFESAAYDAALLLYGQLAVFERTEAAGLLAAIAAALKPGGRLVIELLNQERVDKADSTWWFTDDQGLWGARPFLHLGERTWLADEALSVERFYTLHLESGASDEIVLCDQTYSAGEMVGILQAAGFKDVETYPAWDGLTLYDALEWIVFIAAR